MFPTQHSWHNQTGVLIKGRGRHDVPKPSLVVSVGSKKLGTVKARGIAVFGSSPFYKTYTPFTGYMVKYLTIPHTHLRSWQLTPSYGAVQWHLYPPIKSSQLPPNQHGELAHSSISAEIINQKDPKNETFTRQKVKMWLTSIPTHASATSANFVSTHTTGSRCVPRKHIQLLPGASHVSTHNH